ncbi:MAG: hypothetical protein DCF25_15580 [Leptolyngbya foveolarum]|uniref:Peptidase M23 domain-containing protein n=1 Tax=Leptolyngbya foveolarum TaxID=47253 RepID=A0A2W4VNN4_9CYAN|nr:MAG: hypothetical protein DCF25_15580 [Leptolyngbya foveolarum]
MQLAIRTNLNFYRLVPLALMLWPMANVIADYALSPLFLQSAISREPIYLSKGDRVADYEVSSDYDLARVHPVSGTVEPHYGIDVATPTGTKLIAPTVIEVRCWYDINGGGEVAEVIPSEGDAMQLLHLSTCVDGIYKTGDTFALTGASGIGTGAHLDARRLDKAEPSKQNIEPYLTGKLPPRNTELSDLDLVCSIGAAEGTRDSNCQPTAAYRGHTDPGNGADNLGSFSYQHRASTPEDADRRQLTRLRQAEADLQGQAVDKFGQPLSKPALGAALDLWNQSPQAGESLIDHLPSAKPTSGQIIKARSQSYLDPATGQLDAPGLGNDAAQVEADQSRRTGEVLYQLERNPDRSIGSERIP